MKLKNFASVLAATLTIQTIRLSQTCKQFCYNDIPNFSHRVRNAIGMKQTDWATMASTLKQEAVDPQIADVNYTQT